jgi:hypothetical protein
MASNLHLNRIKPKRLHGPSHLPAISLTELISIMDTLT